MKMLERSTGPSGQSPAKPWEGSSAEQWGALNGIDKRGHD